MPRDSRVPGIESITAQVVGDVMQLQMSLDINRSGPVLWRLTSEAGLPLEFDWAYNGDPAVKGQRPISISISLARRARHDLSVADGRLTNAGRRTATVEYIQSGPGRFARPRRGDALTLKPGESASLSDFELPPIADPAKVTVPPEAVRIEVGPDPFEDFQRDPGLLESVTVRNLLPAATRPARPSFGSSRSGSCRWLARAVTPLSPPQARSDWRRRARRRRGHSPVPEAGYQAEEVPAGGVRLLSERQGRLEADDYRRHQRRHHRLDAPRAIIPLTRPRAPTGISGLSIAIRRLRTSRAGLWPGFRLRYATTALRIGLDRG